MSGELIEEVTEILAEAGDQLTQDQREEVNEICGDLSENLDRIRQHGDRANRIVHDMLMMGRDSGDRVPTNINLLVRDNAQLAFHSARASDSEFRLDIREDLDPDAGEIVLVAQEIGRVILNMVGKRVPLGGREAEAAGGERRRLCAGSHAGHAPCG